MMFACLLSASLPGSRIDGYKKSNVLSIPYTKTDVKKKQSLGMLTKQLQTLDCNLS